MARDQITRKRVTTKAVVQERRTGRVHPGSAVNSSAWMGRGGGEVEAGYPGFRPAETGHGPEDQLLVQLGGAATECATDQVGVAGLEVVRSEHPPDHDPGTESWGEASMRACMRSAKR